jgi:biotin carboxylase
VPPHYDSLLAKVIVHERSREEAIGRMEEALRQFVVRGVATTLPFQLAVMRDEEYRRGDVTTDWVERKFMQRWCIPETDKRRRASL